MYAFLSKVFGRKKDDKEASPSSSQPVLGPGELLGGRFEAISVNTSPIAQFAELDQKNEEAKDKEKEKDPGFSFFKGKWRPASPDVKPTRKLDILPHLSLNFQEPKAASTSPDLGLLFTTDQILSDAVIGQRRLNPLEALVLVQACSRAIIAKGLDTLGIMHPQWYAASHKIQRRVISHFIYLSNLENATSASSPTSPTSPISAFEAEINDTFSSHDIAAILRWGLRHVQIEGDSLGTDDGWYKAFLEAEGASGYPLKAFSEKLAPLLPAANLQLLTATLEIFSSLAAHAEVNGTSGSKLCKIFGLWLLTANRVENKEDWHTFYAKWERTGRMLEHLFLSRIRDESADQRMPVRLLELVRKYPYTKGLSSPTTDLPLLPRPPFTTRLHDALFVRIETELPYGKHKPVSKQHPSLLLVDAFSTTVEGEYAELWSKIIIASKDGESTSFSNIFTDDTVRFLSLVPDEPSEVRSPSLVSPPVSPHKPNDVDKSEVIVAGHSKSTAEFSPPTPLSPVSNGIGSDWAQFSASGFLEVSPSIIPLASTLFDTDIEKTIPPEPVSRHSRKSSKRSKHSKAASLSPLRESDIWPRPGIESSAEIKPEGTGEQKNIIKASQPQIIQLDEAFIDFWSDSLLDTINANWPMFIICKFKPSLVPEFTIGVAKEGRKQKTIQWLVLEQVYTIRAPPVAAIPFETVKPRPLSLHSPSESLRKRFSFWSVSRTASGSSDTSHKGKKRDDELKVGEMGELLEEEFNEAKAMVKVKSPIFRSKKSLDVAPKSNETTKKSITKFTEEAKIDEETAAVSAVTAGVVASAAVMMTHELSADQPSLGQAVVTKTEVDHSKASPLIEAASTPSATAKTVVPSPEPTIKNDDMPLSTPHPDIDAFPEPELQHKLTQVEPVLESEVTVVGNVGEPEDRTETEPILATQVVPAPVVAESLIASVASMAVEPPITTEETEVKETVDVLAQHEPIEPPLVSEVVIPESETAPVNPDPTSREYPPISTSEPDTAQAIEVVPAAVDHSPLAEPEIRVVSQPETTGELEPKSIETKHVFSSVEKTTADIANDETGDSAPVQAAVQQMDQPRSNAIPVEEDILGDGEDEFEIINPSTKLEESGVVEHPEAKDTDVKEANRDLVLPDVTLEPEAKIEASAEAIPASIERDLPEHEPEFVHSDEPAAIIEGQPEVALDENAPVSLGGIEPQPELEQTLSTTAQETAVDIVSSSNDGSAAVVPHELETKVEAYGLDAIVAATATNDLVTAECTETEQPTTEVDYAKHVDEAFTETVRPTTTEDFSSVDKVVPEVTHEPEAGNDSVERRTTLNPEPQNEHEVDDAVPVVDDSISDVESILITAVPLPLEPEVQLSKTEVEAESQAEVASVPTIQEASVDVEVQPDPSLTEAASNVHNDIEVETQVDDTSHINDELIPESDDAHHIEATDIEGSLEDPASSTKESQTIPPLEPKVDLVTPPEEAHSVINLLPSEVGVSQGPGETIPIPENETASVVNIEDQIVAPVDVQSALVETSRTAEPAETIVIPGVEESPETLAPPVESSYKNLDKGSPIISDAVVLETQVLDEGALVSTTEEPAPPVELGLEPETTTDAAPDTPKVSAIPDSTNALDSTAEAVQLPPAVSHQSSTITDESTVVLTEGALDVEVQPEAPVLEETSNVAKADRGAAVDILPEALPATVIADTNEPSATSIAVEGGSIGLVAILNESTAPLQEETPADSQAIAADDTQNVRPEAELASNNGAHTRPVHNPQDNTIITTAELDTGATHVDEMPHEVVKDKDVAKELEPSIIATAVDPTSELPISSVGASETIEHAYPLNLLPDAEPIDQHAPIDASDIPDEHEQSTIQSRPEAVDSVQPDSIPSEVTNSASPEESIVATAAAATSSTQDETTAKAGVDSIEEASTEVSLTGQGITLPTQAEDLFDRGDHEADPTTEKVESIEPVVQEATVSEEANIEKPLTTEDSNGHSDTNGSNVEPSVVVEPVEESPVSQIAISNIGLPTEVVQEPSSLQVAPGFEQVDVAVPATTTNELSMAESPLINNPIEAHVEPETNGDDPDVPEDFSQTDMVTDEVISQTQDCKVDIGTKEPSESVSFPLELSGEQPEILERSGSSIIESSINAAETEAGQKNVSTEQPKLYVESPEVDVARAEEELTDTPLPTEPKSIEAEHVFSSVEKTTADISNDETSDSAPIQVAAQQMDQAQSNTIPVEDVLGDEQDQVEVINPSTRSEEFGTAEYLKAKDIDVKEANRDLVLPDVTLEPEAKTEASAEGIPTSMERDLPEHEPEFVHPDGSAAIIERQPEIALDENAPASLGGIEPQPELEQILSTTAQETAVNVVSSSNDASAAVVAHESEAKVEVEAHGIDAIVAATATNDLVAKECTETEQPTTEVDHTKHADEAFTETVRPTTTEDFPSVNKVVPEVTHEPEAGNDLVEPRTTLNLEPQGEHEVDDTVPAAEENTILDVEPEVQLSKTEVEAESQVEAASVPTIQGASADMEVQPDPSLTEVASTHNDIEVETQVDDASNINDELIPELDDAHHIEAAGTKSFLEDSASGTKESQTTAPLAPEIDLVTSAKEAPSIINLLSSEVGVSQGPGETIPIPENGTAPVVSIGDQIVARPQDGTTTTAELDTGVAHVDEMPHEVAKDKDITKESEPSIIATAIDPTSELSTSLAGASETIEHASPLDLLPDAGPIDQHAPIDASDVPDEHEQSAMQSHSEAVNSVQPDSISSEVMNSASPEGSLVATAVTVTSSTQDETTAEVRVDNTEEASTEASLTDQGIILPTQAEDLFDQGDHETDPTTEKVESIDPVIQEATVSDKNNLVQHSEGPVDANMGEESLSLISEPAIIVPEEPQFEGDRTAPAEAEVAVPPTDNHLQEEVIAPQPELEETVESSCTDEPSVADTPLQIVSRSETVLPEGLQIENGGITPAEEEVAVPSIDSHVQDETIASHAEFKAVESSSAEKPSVADAPSDIVSEPVAEGLQIENHGIAQEVEEIVDPSPADSQVQEEAITPQVEFKEPVETFYKDEPSVADKPSEIVSEPVAEDLQIENNEIAQTEEEIVDPPTDNHVQDATITPHTEFKEVVETSSADKLPVADTPSDIVSESVAESLHIENGGTAQAEEEVVHLTDSHVQDETIAPHAEIKEAVQSSSADEPLVAPPEVISEPVAEDLQIENDEIAQTEEEILVSSTDSHVQDEAIAPHAEFKAAVESSGADEPSVAMASAVSEPSTEIPEDLSIGGGSITQAEQEAVDSPPIDKHAQEEATTPQVGVKPSDVLSELIPEDLQIETSGTAKAEEEIVDPPLTNNPVQEEVIPPQAEVKEVVESSCTDEPLTGVPEDLSIDSGEVAQAKEEVVGSSPTDSHVHEEATTPQVESKPSDVVSELVPEGQQIENGGTTQAEEIVDPSLTDNHVQEEAIAPQAELKEESSYTDEPSVADAPSDVVSGSATVVPEGLQIENDVARAEEELTDPSSLTDNLVQETIVPHAEFKEAVESSSADEPSVTIMVPVDSEPSTKMPKDPSIDNGDITQAESDPPLQTVETEDLAEDTEGQVKATISETEEMMAALSKVETQSFDEPQVYVPETQVSNGNGHFASTQETIGTLLGAISENSTTEDDIKAEQIIDEPIHHPDISPVALDAPSSTD